jgi:hypothetical protein
MRLGDQRPGSRTQFVDSFTGEVLLEALVNEDGRVLLGFKLYDSSGAPVADSSGPQAFPAGLSITADNAEVLLSLSEDEPAWLSYRLYSEKGALLTASDGHKTFIYGGLRMDGKSKPPGRVARGAEATP